jgi:protein SCO1
MNRTKTSRRHGKAHTGYSLAAIALLALAGLAAHDTAQAGGDDHEQHAAADAADPHAHHRHMMESHDYGRSVHQYRLPDLPLVDMNGKTTRLTDALDLDRPVMLNFIFTTCTTICPVLSATFAEVRQQLGAERDRVHLVSITIDPEHDTPERLHAYAARYGAGPEWQFLTGDLENIVAIQKAFDAYRGTKANHEPVTFLRAGAEAPWVRLEGLASAAEVISEYRMLVGH